jgi:hypothetical protein
METGTWVTLKDAGRLNGKAFSFITSTYQCVVKYDILEKGFILEVRLYWFGYSWRRRENEVIDVISSLIQLPIPESEIHKIPLFKEQIELGKNNKELIEFINNDHDILNALIERYSNKIGQGVYDENTSNNIVIVDERFSNKENLKKNFCEWYTRKGDDISGLNSIQDCIVDAY